MTPSHLDEVVERVLDAMLRLHEIVDQGRDSLSYAEVRGKLPIPASDGELIEQMNAEEHRGNVLDDPNRQRPRMKELGCRRPRHSEILVEVAAEAELNVARSEECELGRPKLPMAARNRGVPSSADFSVFAARCAR